MFSTYYEARSMGMNGFQRSWENPDFCEFKKWDNYQMRLGMLWLYIRRETIAYTLKEYYIHLQIFRSGKGVFWAAVWMIPH